MIPIDFIGQLGADVQIRRSQTTDAIGFKESPARRTTGLLRSLEMCDRAYLLESGLLALSGSGREQIENPHVRSAYLAG